MKEPSMYAGIYVKNVPKTANIFKMALNADIRQLQPNMLELTLGKGRLLLNQQEMNQAGNNPADNTQGTSKELELGIWVDNLDDVYQKVMGLTQTDKDAEISYVSDIENKHSGIKDFRFKLPEGYYVRVTASAP